MGLGDYAGTTDEEKRTEKGGCRRILKKKHQRFRPSSPTKESLMILETFTADTHPFTDEMFPDCLVVEKVNRVTSQFIKL